MCHIHPIIHHQQITVMKRIILILGLAASIGLMGTGSVHAQFVVHDPGHTLLNSTEWIANVKKWVTQINEMIDAQELRLGLQKIDQLKELKSLKELADLLDDVACLSSDYSFYLNVGSNYHCLKFLNFQRVTVNLSLSTDLLFKVAIFRVENFDHSTPADTGIYTEDEIVSALNIEKNSNLFAFSTAEKTKELQAQFPYLDKVEVTVQMPATVVVRLTPATERFTCMYSGGWMVLSDALRILRALRFSAKLGFALDPATAAAALAARDTLRTVSAERLYTELDGLLLAPGAGQTLAQYGEILSGAVPEILPCIGCTQPGKWHCYDVWQHSAAAVGALDLRGQDTRGVRVLCWATFLHDIAKPLCRSVGPDGAAHFKGHNQRGAQLARVILRRLKAPAYLVDGAVGLIAVHDAPLPADDVGILKLLNRSGAIFLRRLCALKYADLDAHANTPEVAARRADVAAFERRMNELAKTGCYTMRQLAVNGADLMDIGIPAGPGVGATLQTLLNDVMEGTLPNEREALLAAAVK